ADQAARLGPAGLVRVMEIIGQALIDMRDALEPRVTLEVALVRVAQPSLDVSRAAVLERLERLERRLPAAGSATVPPPPPPPPPPIDVGVRHALGAHRGRPVAPPVTPPVAAPPPAAAISDQPLPTREELTKAWGDRVLASLPGRAKARFGSGRFAAVEDGQALFALPNEHFLPRCREVQGEVEAALAAHFGVPVRLRLVVDDVVSATPAEVDDMAGPVDEGPWSPAPPAVASPADRLKQAFPGAEEVAE
ncbi:MAG: hypothetical protein ACRDZW_07060, partial [Acidimicrobiales bacterium]